MTTPIAPEPHRPNRARRRAAWLVPVLVAGGVAAGVAISTSTPSNATPSLRPLSAKQLLVDVQKTSTTASSGQIRETANFGLPSLPGDQSDASLSWQSFVTGSHSARVWADGPDNQRIALLGQLSEADVVHHGNDVWTYTSSTNSASHTVLTHDARGKQSQRAPSATDYTPAGAASRLLAAVKPSTVVSVDTARTVAGRPAYSLVVRPRDARSTVREVRIAIDASKFVPLQVQVFGAGSSPAFQTGFTHISFARPASSIFAFHVPSGATVSTNPFTQDGHGEHHRVSPGQPNGKPAAGSARTSSAPKVIGSGWTSVVELDATSGQLAGIGNGMLDKLSSPVGSSGERLMHTTLVNAVLLPDGRAFIGAVSPALLEHIAATTH